MEGGGGRRARYVTPDLSYYRKGAQERCEDDKWDEKKVPGTTAVVTAWTRIDTRGFRQSTLNSSWHLLFYKTYSQAARTTMEPTRSVSLLSSNSLIKADYH